MRLGDLVAPEIWPLDLDDSPLGAARDRLNGARTDGLGYPGYSADRALLERAQDQFRERLWRVTAMIELAINLRHDTGVDEATALQRVAKTVDLAPIRSGGSLGPINSADWLDEPPPGPPTANLPTREAIMADPRKWGDWFYQCASQAQQRPQRTANWGAAWERRADMLVRLFRLPAAASASGRTHYDDIVLAVRQAMPIGLLLRNPLTASDVPAHDWSQLVLEALNTGDTPPSGDAGAAVPGWAALAGLHALGFGDALLVSLADSAGLASAAPSSASSCLYVELPAAAKAGVSAGLLLIFSGADPPPLSNPGTPVFLVRRDHLSVYEFALQRLRQAGAFLGTFDERTT